MLRHNVPVRRDLDRIAADNGFDFHIIDNEIYWDESRAYRFTLRQIEEQIEKPTAELHQMCLEVVDRAVKDEEILTQLAIPPLYWDVIAESWRARDPSLYGRMDFASTVGASSSVSTAAESLKRLQTRQAERQARLDAAAQLEKVADGRDLDEKLAEAGIGGSNKSSAQDVLARLQRQQGE